MIPHPFGVAGLIIATCGAFGLLFFKPNPFAGSALSKEQIFSVAPQAYKRYQLEIHAYRISVGAMALGFILQLIDLLLG